MLRSHPIQNQFLELRRWAGQFPLLCVLLLIRKRWPRNFNCLPGYLAIPLDRFRRQRSRPPATQKAQQLPRVLLIGGDGVNSVDHN